MRGRRAKGLLAPKKHLTEELVHPLFCALECASAARCDPVHPSSRAPEPLLGRAKIPLLLQSVQDWVQRARAQSISVPGECLDHRKPIQRACGSVMQQMQANQAPVESTVSHMRDAVYHIYAGA